MKNALRHLQSLVAVALCVVMAIAFTSCSDDDDEPDNKSIAGTWILSEQESNGGYWYCQYNFNSNGTFEGKDWSSKSQEPTNYEFTGKWTISGDLLTLDFDVEPDEEDDIRTFRFTISGNNLTIYDYSEPGPNVFVKR